MTSITLAIVLFVLTAFASLCSAQCANGLVDRLVDVDHNGQSGFFLRASDAECLLLRLERIPDLESHIRLLDHRIERSDALHRRMLTAAELATEMIDNYSAALSVAVLDATEARADLDAWYRSPWLWLTAGIVIGVGGIVAAVGLSK